MKQGGLGLSYWLYLSHLVVLRIFTITKLFSTASFHAMHAHKMARLSIIASPCGVTGVHFLLPPMNMKFLVPYVSIPLQSDHEYYISYHYWQQMTHVQPNHCYCNGRNDMVYMARFWLGKYYKKTSSTYDVLHIVCAIIMYSWF